MERIEFNKKIPGKKQAAFVIIYATDGQPWLDFEGYSDEKEKLRNIVVPTCLMINRYDGGIGFPGGMVEGGESLVHAATREVEEEMGYHISGWIEPVTAHDIGHLTTHSFSTKVSYKELQKIQRESIDAPHFGSEVTGVFMPHLFDYGNRRGMVNLLNANLLKSVREELTQFLVKTNIFSEGEMLAICNRARFNLETLLQ